MTSGLATRAATSGSDVSNAAADVGDGVDGGVAYSAELHRLTSPQPANDIDGDEPNPEPPTPARALRVPSQPGGRDRSGDRDYLIHLRKDLVKRASRVCGSVDAEDVVQEALLRLVSRAELEDGSVSEARLQAPRNLAFGYLRYVGFELFRDRASEHGTERVDEPSSMVDPADQLMFQRAWAQLTAEEQELLWAADVERLDQQALAAEKGVNYGTLRGKVSRARARLRGLLGVDAPFSRPRGGR
jgi:DNA-directed RNA polymerase specialized sigma24 family protein